MQPECQIHQHFSFVVNGQIFHMAQHVLVVAFVANGNYKTRSNMQRNTYSPKVSLRTDTGYGTYRWYKIKNLQHGKRTK